MCTLLPSMKFASLYSVQPDGKQVYLTVDDKLVCPHGECSSTICYWVREERVAKDKGLPLKARGGNRGASSCNCQNTDGLNTRITHGGTKCPPAKPSSLFEYLEEQDSELIFVKGREARRVPHLPGPTFVTSIGQICCRHGASRMSLIKKQKAGCRPSSRLPTCGCSLNALPVRTGPTAMQMGKYARQSSLHAIEAQ